MEQGQTITLNLRESYIQNKLDAWCDQEEILSRQKSRIQWLKEGERNTTFFHHSTIQPRMRNKINTIKSIEGTDVRTQEYIEKELVSHFHTLLTEDHQDRIDAIDQVSSHIFSIITPDHNVALMKEIMMAELEEVVNNMVEGKAPRPEGFTINFFHHCWDLLKHEVLDIFEESRQKQWVLLALNATFLMLMPKETRANDLCKFWPISLCNVIYKIISKVIASRLKRLLPLLISPGKMGYVEGHKILDGIIISHEVLHSLKSIKTPGMLLKLDLSKAFEKIS